MKAQHSPLKSSQMDQTQTPRLPRRSPLSSRGSGRKAVGSSCRPGFAALVVGDTQWCSVEKLGVDDDAAFDRVPYGAFGESKCLHELRDEESCLPHAP